MSDLSYMDDLQGDRLPAPSLREAVISLGIVEQDEIILKVYAPQILSLVSQRLEGLIGPTDYPYNLNDEPSEYTGTIETFNETRKDYAKAWVNAGRNQIREAIRKEFE